MNLQSTLKPSILGISIILVSMSFSTSYAEPTDQCYMARDAWLATKAEKKTACAWENFERQWSNALVKDAIKDGLFKGKDAKCDSLPTVPHFLVQEKCLTAEIYQQCKQFRPTQEEIANLKTHAQEVCCPYWPAPKGLECNNQAIDLAAVEAHCTANGGYFWNDHWGIDCEFGDYQWSNCSVSTPILGGVSQAECETTLPADAPNYYGSDWQPYHDGSELGGCRLSYVKQIGRASCRERV